MAEVKTDLIRLEPGQPFTADEDGAYVLTEAHTHSDILRYVAADIGADDAIFILQTLEASA
jgi:hypothetical protein